MFLCPYCKQDYILAAKIKKTGQIIKICPECDTVWTDAVSDKDGCGFGKYMKQIGRKGSWDEIELIEK